MREYKIGDWVIYIDKNYNDYWKRSYEVSLYKKLAKIIYIDKSMRLSYLLEFKEFIDGYNGVLAKGKSKEGHCLWCDQNEFKLLINTLKFKKWIKG